MGDRAPAHAETPDAVARRLEVDAGRGLSSDEAARRLAEHGANALPEAPPERSWRVLARQFRSTLVWILLAAAGVSAVLGDWVEAVAILIIVALNAALGTRQELRAERALQALRTLDAPIVNARRDGVPRAVPAADLVPGDVVLLEAGDRVPADLRLFEAAALEAQEAALTGESAPVVKEADVALDAETPLAERRNLVFRGTLVTHGRATGVVVATGGDTALGHIAGLLGQVEREPTPLQRRLDRLGRVLALAALAVVALVFVLGLERGEPLGLLALTAVSLAVAAVPEGLPAVVTIALALGARRMLAREALVRRLPAVETLGSVTVICSDKTGTLTRNKMQVVATACLEPSPASPASAVADWCREEGRPPRPVRAAWTLAALASDARPSRVDSSADSDEAAQIPGDPTEVALVEAARDAGVAPERLESVLPRVAEAPFDAARRRMSTVHAIGSDVPSSLEPLTHDLARDLLPRALPDELMAIKGAVEEVLALCDRAWRPGDVVALDDAMRRDLLAAHDRLAGDGLRVLAVATRALAAGERSASEVASLEEGLVFVGLVGLLDPPREAAAEAVATCRRAGLRVLMITGDHPRTARAVARRLGLLEEAPGSHRGEPDADETDADEPDADEAVLTGQELDRLDDAGLGRALGATRVFARVAPEHKLRLVRALQARGEIVAMTGDGVNDAPALKQADIGVAMGRVGTEVAKEAAEMVLRDDNFATLVAAVEEGRRIDDNLRRFLTYLLAANAGEVAVMLAGPFVGLPLPLLPLQILWMNLVTDGLPALALGLEPAEPDAMRRPPRPPRSAVLDRSVGLVILLLGAVGACGALLAGLAPGLFEGVLGSSLDPAWQTRVFTTLTLSQMGLALALRSRTRSVFAQSPRTNPKLYWAVVVTFLLQLAVIYLPPLQTVFGTVALGAGDLALSLLAASLPLGLVELLKIRRGRRRSG